MPRDSERDPEQPRGNWALLMTQLREDPRVTSQCFHHLPIYSSIDDALVADVLPTFAFFVFKEFEFLIFFLKRLPK